MGKLLVFALATMLLHVTNSLYREHRGAFVEGGCRVPHESLKACGLACPLTCESPIWRKCTRDCVANVCQCDHGYVRRKDGKCVQLQDCDVDSNEQSNNSTRR